MWARAAVLIGPGRVAVGTFGSSFGVFDWETNTWDMQGIVAGSGLNAIAVVDGVQYAIGDAGTLFQDGEASAQLGSLCNFLLGAGRRLFSGGQLGQLFDARSGEILYKHHSPLNCGASFLRDGKLHIVIGTYTGEALVFTLEDGDRLRLLTSLKIYENAIKGLVATRDQIFSVCASTAIASHDISDFSLIRFIPNAHELIVSVPTHSDQPFRLIPISGSD